MMPRFSRMWIVVVSLIVLISGMSILVRTRLIAAHDTTTPAPDTLPWCSDAFLRHVSDPNAPPTPPPNRDDTRPVCQVQVTVYALPPGQRPIGGSLPAPIADSPMPITPALPLSRVDAPLSDDEALPWCPDSMFQPSNNPDASPTPLPNLSDTRPVCQVKNTVYPVSPDQHPVGGSLPVPAVETPVPMTPAPSLNGSPTQ